MKWKCVSLCVVAMLGLCASAFAQQPILSSRRTAPAESEVRRPIFSQVSWWAKFGQPVEPAVEAAPAGEPPLVHDHGYGFGYVYGPGSCDCRPPCTDQLWAGYEQMPRRCTHPQYKYRGYCGSCGNHGSCGHVANHCGCTTPAPTCTDAVASCTDSVCCQPKCKKCKKQWFAHWHWGKKGCCDTCDSCSAPVSCGCAMPASPLPPAAGAPAVGPPVPAADEASILKKPLLQRVSATRPSVR